MKNLSLIITLLLSTTIFAQQIVTNNYTINDTPISNPERGFYHHTEVHTGNYNSLNLATLTNYRENESITQILRVFYLEDFVNKIISKEYLENMHADFNTARAAGIKVIVRFAYTKNSSKPFGDATPEAVRNHIFQLKEVLATHHDVISVIQTGFVGAWGEWYYTDHFAGDQPWIISPENWEDRANVVEDLLHVLPKDRMIQLRTPRIKMTIFNTQDAITVPMAFSEENITRAGHHNDCFVASSSDFGTYVDPDLEKPYLEEETKFLPMGGETCALAPPYSDCDNAYSELKRFHWSYLNIDYNTIVLDEWKDQGCYDSVELNLGYRYVLQDATLQTEVHPEGIFDLTINLKNHGFANPYNPRDFEIILKSTTTNQVYKLTTGESMRLWPIQQDFNLAIQAGFPNGIIEDTYNVYLNFPDKSPSLQNNPAYAIRLSNQNIWEEVEGWNDLDLQLTVNSSFALTPYLGNDFFYSLPISEVVESGPTSIYHGTNEETALLFWGRSADHDYRKIDRSSDGITFETITSLPAINDFYKIIDNNNNYYYRFALLGENGEITYSDTILVNASTSSTSKIEITSDGLDEDWKDVLPTASFVDDSDESYILRTHFSLEKAHFSIYGLVNNYKIYLNTDKSKTTGSDESTLLEGMDYLLQNDSLFKYENNQWSLVSTDVVSNGLSIYEVELDHTLFENIDSNYLIPIVAYLNNDSILLSDSDTHPVMHIRNIPPDIPLSFEVLNSIPFPEARLEIHWEACLFCDGYILEKSDDGVNFTFLEDIESEDEIYYHDFLPNGTHYYKIRSYNILGESQSSEIESGILGPTSTTQLKNSKEIKIWPNPANEFISTDLVYDHVLIRNVYGELVYSKFYDGKAINISQLQSGVYFFVFNQDGQEWVKRVVKY